MVYDSFDSVVLVGLAAYINSDDAVHSCSPMFQQAAQLLDGRAPEIISPRQSPMATPGYRRSDSYRPQNDDLNVVDPDELFAKCTISEVKAAQQKLRSVPVACAVVNVTWIFIAA